MSDPTTGSEADTALPLSTLPPGNIVQPEGGIFVLYMILGATGIVGNTLSIIVLSTFPHMRKKLTNLFLIHQSIIDLLTSVVLIANTLTMKQYYLTGPGAAPLCIIWQSLFILWSIYSVSTHNFCAMSVEQYVSIVHPLQHKKLFTRPRVYLAMGLAWFLGFLITLFTPLTSGLIGGACYRIYFWPNTLTRRAIGVYTFVLKFFMPLALLVYTYTRILLLVIRKISAPVGQQSSTSQPSQFSGAKRNTIKMLFMVCVGFFLCWVWNMVYFLILNLGVPLGIGNPFYQFTVVAVFSNCCVNPFIYATQYKEFRRGIKALFLVCVPKQCKSARVDVTISATSTA